MTAIEAYNGREKAINGELMRQMVVNSATPSERSSQIIMARPSEIPSAHLARNALPFLPLRCQGPKRCGSEDWQLDQSSNAQPRFLPPATDRALPFLACTALSCRHDTHDILSRQVWARHHPQTYLVSPSCIFRLLAWLSPTYSWTKHPLIRISFHSSYTSQAVFYQKYYRSLFLDSRNYVHITLSRKDEFEYGYSKACSTNQRLSPVKRSTSQCWRRSHQRPATTTRGFATCLCANPPRWEWGCWLTWLVRVYEYVL